MCWRVYKKTVSRAKRGLRMRRDMMNLSTTFRKPKKWWKMVENGAENGIQT